MKKLMLILMLIILLHSACAEPVKLVISGNDIPLETVETYARERGIQIVLNEAEDTMDLVTEALTHKDNTDLYFLSTNIDQVYLYLRDRGYLMPIEEASLCAFAGAIEPSLYRELAADGRLCAVPYACIVQKTPLVDRSLWSEIGFAEGEYPRTWEEWARFLAREYPVIHNTHPDIYAFESDSSRAMLQQAQNQLYSCLRQGDADTDSLWNAFGEMLMWYRMIDWNQTFPNVETRKAQALFELLQEPFVHDDGKFDYMLLGMGQTSGRMRVSMNLMAINPNTTHAEDALALVGKMVEDMGPENKIVLLKDEASPVLDEEVSMNWAAAQQKLDAYARRIETETDLTRRKELELEAETYRQSEEEYYEKYRYLIGPEAVDRFKTAAEGGYSVAYSSALTHEEAEVLNRLRTELMQENITVGDYVEQLRRRWEADLLEGN